MQIRDYRKADEEGWLRCRVLAFLHTAYYDDVYREKDHYEHPSIELVAEAGSQIVGLIDVECETARGTVCAECSSLGAMVWHLAVHPDFQRCGIGEALLREAERRLLNRQIFQLEAYTRDDDWVNRWYAKNGFRETSHYLHVFMEADELAPYVVSTERTFKPITCFAHYAGKAEDGVKSTFRRVHECRCYRKDL
ncbi:MAG: GNAT family N-acetyltransferase [Sporolactobacillus sp.]